MVLSGHLAMPPDIRLLILPLPEFALLPFGAFLDKLRFSADDEDYSRQRYCAWTLGSLTGEPVASSSGAVLQVEAIAQQRLADYHYLVLFGGRNAGATARCTAHDGPCSRSLAGCSVSVH